MTGSMMIIPADDLQLAQHIKREAPPELEELQGLVGGFIEQVPHWTEHLGKPCVAYCNEEGKPKGLPINARATFIYLNVLSRLRPDRRALLIGDGIELRGTVVVVIGLPDREDGQ